MKTGYNDFCKKYREKIKNDIDIKENKLESIIDFRERIKFFVSYNDSVPGIIPSINSVASRDLFVLDQDDVDYLYNKYSKLVVEEMEANIKEIKISYNHDN